MIYRILQLFILPAAMIALVSCQSKAPKVEMKQPAEVAVQSVAHPAWAKNLSIYEVNLRQYSVSGSFRDFQEHLPRLKEMGVGILWLMPIHPIGEKNRKGSLGSYYSVRDYLAVNPEHGTMEEFRELVQAIHEQGMYVIIDWVANHCAWDNALLTEHPDWFTKDENGDFMPPVPDWSDVVDFDYDNAELRRYMIDALKFWVRETDIDGFRCDVAGMMPREFWEQARPELDAIKPVFMLAENEDPADHSAFDMTYGWELMHLMNAIAADEKDASYVDAYFERQKTCYRPDDYRMYFTTNHDENSWNGTVFERLGDGAKVFAVLTATVPGMPLVYSGQEVGLNRRLSFFEKDSINWKDSEWGGFYTKLLKLKQRNPVLWNGSEGGSFKRVPTMLDQYLFVFSRIKGDDAVLVVLNFSTRELNTVLDGLPPSGKYRELFTGEMRDVIDRMKVMMPPWDYRVYVREGKDEG